MRHSGPDWKLHRGTFGVVVPWPLQQLGASPRNRLAAAGKMVRWAASDDDSSGVQYVLCRIVFEYAGRRNGQPTAFCDREHSDDSDGGESAPEFPDELIYRLAELGHEHRRGKSELSSSLCHDLERLDRIQPGPEYLRGSDIHGNPGRPSRGASR